METLSLSMIVEDRRDDQGKRIRLPLILILLLLEKVAGEQSISGVAGWVKKKKMIAQEAFELAKGCSSNFDPFQTVRELHAPVFSLLYRDQCLREPL